MHVAGVICKDWSSMGKGGAFTGDSLLCFVHWVRERLVHMEDIVIAECTARFDWKTIQQLFAGVYELTPLRINPAKIGFPVSRPRLYMVMLKVGAKQWSSKVKSSGGAEKLFYKLFGCKATMPGSDHWRADPELVQSALATEAAKRGLPATRDGGKLGWLSLRSAALYARAPAPLCMSRSVIVMCVLARPWHARHLLPTSKREYLKMYEAIAKDAGLQDRGICNLVQRPQFCNHVMEHVPTLLQQSYLWSMGHKRALLPQDSCLCCLCGACLLDWGIGGKRMCIPT